MIKKILQNIFALKDLFFAIKQLQQIHDLQAIYPLTLAHK